jgi:hypothetical protein
MRRPPRARSTPRRSQDFAPRSSRRPSQYRPRRPWGEKLRWVGRRLLQTARSLRERWTQVRRGGHSAERSVRRFAVPKGPVPTRSSEQDCRRGEAPFAGPLRGRSEAAGASSQRQRGPLFQRPRCRRCERPPRRSAERPNCVASMRRRAVGPKKRSSARPDAPPEAQRPSSCRRTALWQPFRRPKAPGRATVVPASAGLARGLRGPPSAEPPSSRPNPAKSRRHPAKELRRGSLR